MVAVRIFKAYPIQAVLQALEVLRQTKNAARIHWDNFIHPIAKNKASIQNGDMSFFNGHKFPV